MSGYFETNLSFEDFSSLLSDDDLAEEPVPIEVFVQDRKYLGLPPLSPIQSEIVKHSTQIFKPETLIDLYGEEKGLKYYNDYTVNEVVAQIGKGGGKDHVSRISMAYVVYLIHCLRDPMDYFNKSRGVYIDLINLAVNAKQAQQVFFDPLKNILLSSPWANEVGFEPRVQEIFWYSRPVRMFSGHSESEGWEGYEALIVVLDEISAFRVDAEIGGDMRNRGSASQIYAMSKASVASRFPSVGKVILLSFPRFRNDFIQEKYNKIVDEAEEKRLEGSSIDLEYGLMGHKAWGIKAATWEVNPTKKREDFDSEFRRDPVQSEARFACNPPTMEDAYFRDPDAVRQAFSFGEDPLEDDGTYKPWFNGSDGHSRFIHIDLGLKRDRVGLAMVHTPGFKEIRTSIGLEKLPIINVDIVHSWEAPVNGEIPFSEVRGFIVELTRKFPVVSVTFDYWNSTDMIQSLRSMGVNADYHTVKRTDYDTLSTAIYDRRVRGYWNELLVEEELLKLKLIKNTKVDHPSSGCFVGDTLIQTFGGASVEIKNLDGKEVTVVSADKDGNIFPGKARGRKTKETSLLVDVSLDNGEKVRCTPEHRFMLRDGSYREAQYLRPGIDKLMSENEARKAPDVSSVILVQLDKSVPVYDLEVDVYDNFALSAGIIVHNSKDLADAVAGATFKAMETSGFDSELELEIFTDEWESTYAASSKVAGANEPEPIPDELEEWLFSV